MPRPSSISVSVVLLCALPVCAQSKKPGATAAFATPMLPLLMGAGGLLVGGALGFALKKTPKVAAVAPVASLIFDEVPFPLAFMDAGEKITRANPAFSAFVGLPDAVGTSFPQWIHPDDLATVREKLNEVAAGEIQACNLPARLFHTDGQLFHTTLRGRKSSEPGQTKAALLSLQDVSAQVEAQSELNGARDAITALYEVISSDKSSDLDGTMKSLLAMGCGRFELPIGVLGCFVGDGFETIFVQSPDRRVRPALQLSRRDTSTEAQLLGLNLLPSAAQFRATPLVSRNDEIAYLGAPVLVGNELFGMLSFSNTEPRTTPFSGGDAQLLQLMAEWVGGEIERDRARQTLENQQKALVEANRQLELLATHDPLTGAKNRRAFNERLEEEWSRAKRYNTPLSLVLMDVDKFKSFNDTFGHPAGDEVLKRVARALMGAIRTTDFFARYGGEEFVLLLPNTDAEGALILANRLREKIELTPWKERAITVSMGVSSLDSTFKTAAELTQSADTALYASKEKGRNRVTHTHDLAPEPEIAPSEPLF